MGAKQSLHVCTDGAPGVSLAELRIEELYFCASNFFNVPARGVINREYLVARLEYVPELGVGQRNRSSTHTSEGKAAASSTRSRSSRDRARQPRERPLETSDSCSSHVLSSSLHAASCQHQHKPTCHETHSRSTPTSPSLSPRSSRSEHSDGRASAAPWDAMSETHLSSPSSPTCCSSSPASGRTSDSHGAHHPIAAPATASALESILFCPSFGHWASESCFDPLDLTDISSIPSPLTSPASPGLNSLGSLDSSVSSFVSSQASPAGHPDVAAAKTDVLDLSAFHSVPSSPTSPHLGVSATLTLTDRVVFHSPVHSPAAHRLASAASSDLSDSVIFHTPLSSPAAPPHLTPSSSLDLSDCPFRSALASLTSHRLSPTSSLGSADSSAFHSALNSPASPHLSRAASLASGSYCPSPRSPAVAHHHIFSAAAVNADDHSIAPSSRHDPATHHAAAGVEHDRYSRDFFSSLRTPNEHVSVACSADTRRCSSPALPSAVGGRPEAAAGAVGGGVATLDLNNLWATVSVSDRGDAVNVWLHSTPPPPSTIGDAFPFTSCAKATPTLQELVDLCCQARSRWVLVGVIDGWRVSRQVFLGLLNLYRRRAAQHRRQRQAVERTVRAFKATSKMVFPK